MTGEPIYPAPCTYESLTEQQKEAVGQFMSERLKQKTRGILPGTLHTVVEKGRTHAFVSWDEHHVYEVSPITSLRLVLDPDGRPLGCPKDGLLYLSDVSGEVVVRILPTTRYTAAAIGIAVE
ncbi:hypothetical protein [Gluconobacter cerinus]|uniref:Uncharacterized protein n=2 Tax=Gluconobacter cerinus TaxID=38307 RepID=A0AAV5NK34_9PROT|nr:hypothetical protein [Gluconobacter cerinus]MBS1023391.1 hypothetical protein [Gluconobacter cerinus]GLQ64380.1 hypothetical protein GCM10007867_32280 [Gluconobacter cerinus]